MMRNPAPFADWRLRCPDVEIAIELHRVAIDDLSAKPFGQIEGEI